MHNIPILRCTLKKKLLFNLSIYLFIYFQKNFITEKKKKKTTMEVHCSFRFEVFTQIDRPGNQKQTDIHKEEGFVFLRDL